LFALQFFWRYEFERLDLEECEMKKKRLVIGISGASGAQLGITILRLLQKEKLWESHLVLSGGAERTIKLECGSTIAEVSALADVVYDAGDIGAAIASGTFKTAGMIVAPCSMKTLAGIANGYSENLLLRAADVTIKERRPLVLLARETPLSAIHLRNMLTLAQCGAIILPPMISYYQHPESVDAMTHHVAAKALDCFGIEMDGYCRWNGAS